jgi:hypothetical protein
MDKFLNNCKDFMKDEEGLTVIEYVIGAVSILPGNTASGNTQSSGYVDNVPCCGYIGFDNPDPISWLQSTSSPLYSFKGPTLPNLRKLRHLVGNMNMEDAASYLETKIDSENKMVSVAGVNVQESILTLVIPLLTLALQMLLYLHLRQLDQETTPLEKPLTDLAWIGVSNLGLNKVVEFCIKLLFITVIPVGALGYLLISVDDRNIYHWLWTGISLVVTLFATWKTFEISQRFSQAQKAVVTTSAIVSIKP